MVRVAGAGAEDESNAASSTANPCYRILCWQPLMIEFPQFFSEAECAAMIGAAKKSAPDNSDYTGKVNHSINPKASQLSAEQRDAVDKLHSLVGDFLDCPSHKGEEKARFGFTPANRKLRRRQLPLGLHVDTNRRPHRFATAIVYLATLPTAADGCTVFPCARQSARSEAARKQAVTLLSARVEHTMAGESSSAVQSIHSAAQDGVGVSLRPVAGRLVIFFGRDHNGQVAPECFHGGAAVLGALGEHLDRPAGKWTVQLFKEVPRNVECSVDRYSSQRWRDIACSKKAHRAFTRIP